MASEIAVKCGIFCSVTHGKAFSLTRFSVHFINMFYLKVAYAKKDLHADVILDMATLTGAQGVATGRYHASLLTNDEDWEPVCAAAGKASGDLVVSGWHGSS